LNAQ